MAALFEQLSLIVIYAGIAQGIFVTLLLNNKSVRGSRANWFLSVLLLAMSFSVLHTMFAGRVITHFAIKSYALGDPSFFLIAPLLWFYVQELTGRRVRLSFQTVAHLFPCIVSAFFSLFLTHFSIANPLIDYLNGHRSWSSGVFWFCMVVQFSAYLFFIHKRWLTYQKLIEQEVSNTENVSIGWVRFFMGVFLAITLTFLLMLLNVIHHGTMFWSGRTIAVIFSLSIFALGYKGILQKEIFNRPITGNQQVLPEPASETPAKKPEQQLIDRLLQYMADEKPYLDPELTLSDLAKRLHISRSVLSQLINEGIGDNFYNFVNRYRVEQVKAYMNNPAMKHLNLLGLALEAGFKSKSTFNLIFKRFTGQTPSEYLKRND
ncbi:AraC family transcriptional regulator [Spirosoma sp. SC4-14]|uniref:helix-turn-helix domain-containing protein n=1 Tax=Spirosoma sp. SC4-14 TaxID=3128900 RepID=UPI0030CE6BEB